MTRPRILGVPADPITFAILMETIGAWVADGSRLYQICTVNPEFIMIAQRDSAFYDVLQHSDLNIIDGWGAVLALRLRGVTVPERVTGSDGVPMIAEHAAKHGWRLFLLGAGPGIAQKAADIFSERHPGILIAGTYEGSPHPDEAEVIIEMVNAAKADILLVAYGAPAQDLWIHQHRERLKVKVAMGVGGSLDFVTGYIPRAPLWMRKAGIEWLYRLYLQPSRWRRMLRLPRFALMALLFRGRPPKHAGGRTFGE
jgi:N-acetylglucosaminyldiphosphoundecaprenol N-acetyl-beta-D-mannosaminyltransferase